MRSLLQRAGTVFSIAAGHHHLSEAECFEAVTDARGDGQGIVVGEVHGDYAQARFVAAMMPFAAASGIKRMYVEMFQQPQQPVLNAWQKQGQDVALVDSINRENLSYATHIWHHYWQVLQAARENKIEVVAIEPATIYSPYPGMEMLARNIAWQKRIDEVQGQSPVPYMLYCGRGHSSRRTCRSSPIHEMLGIKGIFLRRGQKMGVSRSLTDPALKDCWMPKAADQTPICGIKIMPVTKIRLDA